MQEDVATLSALAAKEITSPDMIIATVVVTTALTHGVFTIAEPMTILSRRILLIISLKADLFPGGSNGKESTYSAGDTGFNPWVGKIL